MFEQILSIHFLGNSVQDYLWALLAFVITLIILKIFEKIVIKKLKKLVDHTTTKFDNLLIESVEDIGFLFYLLVALYLSLKFVKIPSFIEKGVYYLLLIVFVYYITKGAQKLLEYGVKKAAQKEGREVDASVVKILTKVLKITLWVIVLILLLSNLGYNVSSLIAGLGIGGIAIAFAIQNILSDIFSSFSIYFDKPFKTGDFIVVGKDKGTVKKIGLKSTRIQTLQGEELIISNKELTQSRVHNYKRMKKRRTSFSFGVVYETETEKLRKIPEIVKEIINKIELAELNRVFFTEFGDFSLKFEVVYNVDSPDYNKALEIQEDINLKLKERFEEEGIEMAYPTQTIFINRTLKR